MLGTPNTENLLPQLDAIVAKALYGTSSTPAHDRFKDEVQRFLDDTADIDDALSIVITVGETLGLVPRDHGQFAPRKTAANGQGEQTAAASSATTSSVAQDDDEQDGSSAVALNGALTGKSTAAPAAAKQAQDEEDEKAKAQVAQTTADNEPDSTYWDTAAQSKKVVYARAFEFKIGLGKMVGELWVGELSTVELKSDRDAFIVREIRRQAGRLPTDAKVKDTLKPKAVWTILKRAEARFKKMEARRATA